MYRDNELMAKDKITDFIVTEKGADFLKRAAAGVRLTVAAKIMVLAVSVNAHDLRICPQWLPVNPEKPLKVVNDGNIELGMLTIRWIGKPGQVSCDTYAGHPNSCERVMFQWSRRYDVFPFPIGNRLESKRVDYVGGIPAEAICQ